MATTKQPAAFVGRAEELTLLTERLRLAASGHPQVVLIEGEAGVGKTALVARALGESPEVMALWARADETEREVPFGVIDQLLRAWPGGRQTLPSDGADPLAVGAAFLELFTGGPQHLPVAIVVDDLPWADLASVQALLFALRRLRVDAIIAAFTTRTEEAGRLPRGLYQLLSSRGGIRLELGGLGRDELRELARDAGRGELSVGALDRLLRHTRGNPLHARTLLEELPAAAWAADAPLPAPRSFAGLVLDRLASTGPLTQTLVAAAAVLGQQGRVADAAKVSGQDEPAMALAEAARADLLTAAESPLGARFSFTHPLVRAAVYHALGPARRAELHRTAAASAGGDWGRLRHLAAAASGEDPALAGELAAFAARELTAGPARAGMAAAAYRAAARLAPDRPTREDHLLRALECLLAAGDAGQAALLADLLPDFEDSARLRYLRAWLAMIEGRWEEADRGLRAAWDASLREGERALAATVAASLATMNVNQAGRLSEAAEWARRSLEYGAAEVATLGPRAVLPMALAATGRYEEALATVSPGPGEDDLGPGDVDGITGRGVVRLWIGDLEAARTDLDRAVSTAKSLGTFATEVIALTYLSEAEFRIGAWDDAIVHGELAASTASDADQTWMHTLAHANAALPLAWRGRWDAAGQHVDRALEVATLLPHDANLIWAYTARATLAAAFEDHAGVVEATEVVEAAMRGVIEPGIKPWWVLRADALVALGEPDRAEAQIGPFEERARAMGSSWALLACARIHASAQLARGRHDAAVHTFRGGLELLPRCADPFERARFQLAFGELLRRQGHRREALGLLESAERVLAHLGAARLVDRAHRELDACGLTARRRSDDARLELTPQEQAVAHLVTQGLRNRDVAARLVVSVKTVEYHLANAYRKMGVSNRVEMTTRLADAVGPGED